MKLTYMVKKSDEDKQIKDIIKNEFKISTRLFTKLKRLQKIYLNKEIAYVNNKANVGDIITIDFDYDEDDDTVPEEGRIEILYEDDYYLAVNKPANIVVHPCSYHPNNTLANFVKYYLKNNKKIRPVNRLDNGTSGICLFAKNELAQELFIANKKEIKKEYLAIIEGVLDEKKDTINLPISRKEKSIIERCVDEENGQTAITHYEVLKEGILDSQKVSLLKINIETGRTHQIRVHMSYIGHPILGDTLYGKKSTLIARQALHAFRLSFIHPVTNKKIYIEAPLENDILMLTNMLNYKIISLVDTKK